MTDTPPTYETPTSRVWHLRTGASSKGEVHEQRVEYRPGSPFPPMHLHPRQDEYFEVERGAMVFDLGGEEHVVGAGGSIDIPRGTPHRARNASTTEPAQVHWTTRPALRTTEFFLTAVALGGADPLDQALLAQEFRDVFRITGPARVAVVVLGRVARLLGRSLPAVDEDPPR